MSESVDPVSAHCGTDLNSAAEDNGSLTIEHGRIVMNDIREARPIRIKLAFEQYSHDSRFQVRNLHLRYP